MKRDVEILKNGEASFDCIVIGGGIQGAGIAREASLQGLKTLLVDRGDFASGTSSRSTKLIHGGLRYLEQGRFKLVREALSERKILLRAVPHLVKPLPFLFPVYGGDRRSLWQVGLGLSLYDALAKGGRIAHPEKWDSERIRGAFPQVNPSGLKGGLCYWDAQMDDSRLCLEVIKAAHKLGCHVINYARVVGFVKEGEKISAVHIKDLKTGETFEVKGKIFINAAGIRADEVRLLSDPSLRKRLRWSKGIHLVSRRLFSSGTGEPLALIRPTRDKRVFFIIPWVQNTTLIGTTDTDFKEKPSDCFARKEDVECRLQEFCRLFPSLPLKKNDFYITFSGLRALVDEPRRSSSSISREYAIEELDSGLVSILGGKYTTFRSLAVKVVEKVLKRLALQPRYEDTSYLSLEGLSLDEDLFSKKQQEFEKRAQAHGIFPETRTHLWNTYGTHVLEILKLLDYDPLLKEGVLAGRLPLKAEVVYAIKDEMALTLTDFLRRRSQLFFSPNGGLEMLDSVAQVYQDYLHWSDEEIERQKQEYRQEVQRNIQALDAVRF